MDPTNTECPLFEQHCIRRWGYQKHKMESYLQWVYLCVAEGERKMKLNLTSDIGSLIWEHVLIGTLCLGWEFICYSTTQGLWVPQNCNPFQESTFIKCLLFIESKIKYKWNLKSFKEICRHMQRNMNLLWKAEWNMQGEWKKIDQLHTNWH